LLFLFCSTLNLGFRLDVLFGVPSKRFLASRRSRAAGLVLASDFQRTRFPDPLSSLHSFLPKAGAKVQPFFFTASTFFKNFSFLFYLTDFQSENFSKQGETGLF
jgi:hypothetical protein